MKKVKIQFHFPLTQLQPENRPCPLITYKKRGLFKKKVVQRWMLTKDYTLKYLFRGKFSSLIIPRGFVWDGASIPRIAWSKLGMTPGGSMLLPSLIHDALYRSKGLTQTHGQKFVGECIAEGKDTFTRDESDLIFKNLIEYTGCYNKLQVGICYGIVNSKLGEKHFGGPAPEFGS